jgi:signal transduction histidine kinase
VLRGLSLARKCLLLFGGGVVLIVLAALAAPWVRMNSLIDEGQLEVSRQAVAMWERAAPTVEPEMGPSLRLTPPQAVRDIRMGIEARELTLAQARQDQDPFVRRAIEMFEREPEHLDYQDGRWSGTSREYRYAKAVWRAGEQGPQLVGLVELSRRSISATTQLVRNTLYLLSAGAVVLAISMLAFWIITRRLVLAPVERLREAAERVRVGNLAVRADLRTGDEFEDLANTFNAMLTDMQAAQDRLRGMNAQLDVKLHELAETNTALHQTAKAKGEFLASVSHELRTPLNSINGFAELLLEMARSDAEKPDAPANVAKRIRYNENILTAGRGLLSLINSLLEMARIEAGKVDLRIERVSLKEASEGLLGLIAPQASRKGIVLKAEVADDVPLIRTDPRKFQQIMFNFLSNAVKFSLPLDRTGREPSITIRAERLPASSAGDQPRVRVSVIDNGPGIAKDEQDRIFEKFYQVEGGYSREQAGTGLGLAIAKDLAGILQSDIQLVSDVGRGSMFSLIMPVSIDGQKVDDVPGEQRAREAVAEMRERSGVS